MTRILSHQKMMKLEHFMKSFYEICVIEYLQGVCAAKEWSGNGHQTCVLPTPPSPLAWASVTPHPRQDSGWLSKCVPSHAYLVVFTVFTAGCLSQVPSSENQNEEKRNDSDFTKERMLCRELVTGAVKGLRSQQGQRGNSGSSNSKKPLPHLSYKVKEKVFPDPRAMVTWERLTCPSSVH